MTLWFVFALMTAAAIFAVLWPLGHRGRPPNDGSETTVYKDQLEEVDRDLAAGLIGSSEAEAARVEISSVIRLPPRASGCGASRQCWPWRDCRSYRWRSTFRWAPRASAIFR